MLAGAIFAGVSVLLGAFGAHKLKELIEPKDLITWETACRYQMYHALGLLYLGIVGIEIKQLKKVAFCFITGILLFSGSLYFIALKEVLSVNLTVVGPLTPIGGAFFIAGWFLLGWKLLKHTE